MRFLQVFLPLIAALIVAFIFLPEKAPELQRFGVVTPFSLTNHEGKVFSSEEMKGKVWLANFFFASCSSVCPRMQKEVEKIARTYKGRKDFAVVSITVDPEKDTPTELTKYREQFNFENAPRWEYLTGAISQIENVSREIFRLNGTSDPNLHSTRIVLVDQNGEVRGFYESKDQKSITHLVRDIDRLLR